MVPTMRTSLFFLPLLPLAPATAQTSIYALEGQDDGQLYGRHVAYVGDRDGDGFDDFLVGAPQDGTSAANAGAVYVVDGQSGMVEGSVLGDGVDHYLGWSVAAAGDVDADGTVDFLAGAPSQCGLGLVGYARVYSGADLSTLHTTVGEGYLDWYGYAVSAAGDQDLDGFGDFAVGAHQFCGGFLLNGYVNAYSGADGSLRWTAGGASTWDTFGFALDLLGDYDVDGVPDLLVGSPGSDAAGYDAGRFYLLSGVDGSTLYWEDGEAGLHYAAWSVAAIGDATLDGVLDYAIGVPGEQDNFEYGDDPHPAEFGKLQIHDGAAHAVLFDKVGPDKLDHLGWSIANVGDLDVDGHPEVAAAATRYDIQSTKLSLGPAYIDILSSATGEVLQHIEGPANEENFQVNLGGGGDVNGDGTPDLLFGSEGLESTPGLVRAFSGRELPLSSPLHLVSISGELEQDLAIASDEHDGMPYQVIGGFSGTSPGFWAGPHHVPLNVDAYTKYTFDPPSGTVLKHSSGTVGVGKGVATFQPDPELVSGLVGQTLHHVLLIFDPLTGAVEYVSSPVPGTLLP